MIMMMMMMMIIIIITVLQSGSSLDHPFDTSQVHSVRYLSVPFVNSTCFKVFFNPIHPSYGGGGAGRRPTFLVPSGFVNVSFRQEQRSSVLNICPSHLTLVT